MIFWNGYLYLYELQEKINSCLIGVAMMRNNFIVLNILFFILI